MQNQRMFAGLLSPALEGRSTNFLKYIVRRILIEEVGLCLLRHLLATVLLVIRSKT